MRATTTIRVEVTAEDVRTGRPDSCVFCPVARAIERHVRADVLVHVFETGYTMRPRHAARIGDWPRFDLPLAAIEFVARFDARREVEPFAFDVLAVSRLLREEPRS